MSEIFLNISLLDGLGFFIPWFYCPIITWKVGIKCPIGWPIIFMTPHLAGPIINILRVVKV